MPETYEEYLKRFKKAHGHTRGSLTKEAFTTYYSWPMVAQRAGLKPGRITRGIEERTEAAREVLRRLRR